MKALLFDMDGTLVDTLPLYIRSYDLALQEQGFHFSPKEIVETCFGKTEDIICQSLGIPNQTKQFQTTYFKAVNEHFTLGKPFPNVVDLLENAKNKGIFLGVISFAYNWYVEGMLKGSKLDKYFDIVIGHNDVTHPKPDPEAVYLAIKKAGIEPSDSVMIGDSKSDIVMGKAAGCKTVLFYPPEYSLFYDLSTLKTSNPDIIIDHFSGLETFISL